MLKNNTKIQIQIYNYYYKSKIFLTKIYNILKNQQGIRSGVHLIISLLRQAQQNNSKLCGETLDFLLELFAEIKPLSFWGKNKIDIILENSLHTVSDFLEEIVSQENASLDDKSKALKVLFSLGILRGSLPNLLAVVSIIYLRNEISILQNEKSDSSFSLEDDQIGCSKIYFQPSQQASKEKRETNYHISVTTDSVHVYIYSENEGLLKVGTGNNLTMLGKVYNKNSSFRLQEKGSVCFVMGKLYYRSDKIGVPIVEINIETLQQSQEIISYDQSGPNFMFTEMSTPEIELNHLEYEKNSFNLKDQQKDKKLLRPSQRSPMITEESSNDSDDDEENESQNTKQSKFGVNIYDPLSDFILIKTVELKSLDQKNLAPFTVKALDQASFACNGSHILVSIPGNCSESGSNQVKEFDLKSGFFTHVINQKLDVISYDHKSNCILNICRSNCNIDSIQIFKNFNVSSKFVFADDHEQYNPYENHLIGDIAQEELGYQQSDYDLKGNKFKEEWQILLNLGFRGNLMQQQQQNKSNDSVGQKSEAQQLLILSNIARFGESFTDEIPNSSISLNDFRKPYCVNLIPQVFVYLEQFIDHYLACFDESDQLLGQLSFLCTLRIIKYNLANAEQFSLELRKLGIQLPEKNFRQKLNHLIIRILKNPLSDDSDMQKALEEEVLNILKYSLSIIYPELYDIVKFLNSLIQQKSLINEQISQCILFWLKQKKNIIDLVKILINEQNQDMINQLIQIIDYIIMQERLQYKQYMEYDFPQKYHQTQYSQISMTFLIQFQQELLFQVGVFLQDNKNMENSIQVDLHYLLSKAIFEQAVQFNEILENKTLEVDRINQKRIRHDLDYQQSLQEQNSKKKKTVEQLIIELNFQQWENATDFFVNQVYFSQLLSLHINSLALISSHFLIASKTVKIIQNYLKSFNKLYNARKNFINQDQNKQNILMIEKVEHFESDHPYERNIKKKEKITIPGAKQLTISFDPQCNLKKNCDYLQFYTDDQYKEKFNEKLERSETKNTFPSTPWIINSDTIYYYFHSDSCRNSNWGYKFTVSASIQSTDKADWMSDLHRTTCWVASKCAAQLINGSQLQQALLQDEEQKYNILLSSQLFSGGLEKQHFQPGNETIWVQLQDIINEFQTEHLKEFVVYQVSEEEQINYNILLQIIQNDNHIQPMMKQIYQQFEKQCQWANLGGEKADNLVRVAYAVILKHSGLINDFRNCLQNPMDCDLQKINLFVKKWNQANRMRTWLVEKRKEIDDINEKNKNMVTAPKRKKSQNLQQVVQVNDKKAKKKKKVNSSQQVKTIVQQNEFQDDETLPAEPLQIKDTEEIIDRMIAQITKKGIFMCQLVQTKQQEQLPKQLLFKQSSSKSENKQDEWKVRLQQWKSVRQSKNVIKSLEDEFSEIQHSISTSVLACLQSPVSLKRLKNQVESVYLRAICRVIGLQALQDIIYHVPDTLFIQDCIGWLCSALRGQQNKLYHYSDNLQGCGQQLDHSVRFAFKNLLEVIMKCTNLSSKYNFSVRKTDISQNQNI